MSVTPSSDDKESELETERSRTIKNQKYSEHGASSSSSSTESEDTSSSAYEQRTVTGSSRKRKLVTSTGHRLNRLKARYNDQYRELFNETINTAARGTIFGEYKGVPSSQYGVSCWTSDEKATFFDALARKGEQDIHAISLAVGTKSEMEICVYLQLLQKALLETSLHEPRQQLLGLTDLPAAAEISEECCLILDQRAHTLSLLQQKHEEKVEQENHAQLWLLNRDTSRWVQERLGDDEDGGADILKEVPAVSLLNLPVWLELSERIFMNAASPREDENWRAIAEETETPSIMNTAFSDFHNLAISVTKRLIQSSLFYAMSRLRATDSSRYRYQPVVRSRDVLSALKVLGMRPNAYEFWTRAARRCGLDVDHDIGNTRRKVKALNYDEVERLLEEGGSDAQPETTDVTSNSNPDIDVSRDDQEDGSESTVADALIPGEEAYEDSHQSSAPDESSNASDSPSGEDQVDDYQDCASKQGRARRQLDRDQDEYAETFDRYASLAEEQRLREMLGDVPTCGVKAEDVELPKKPPTRRKAKDDLVNWRDKIDFWSEWEVFETPVPCDSFHQTPEGRYTHNTKQRYGRDTEGSHEIHASWNEGAGGEDVGLADDETIGVANSNIPKGGEVGNERALAGKAAERLEGGGEDSEDENSDVDMVDSNTDLDAGPNAGGYEDLSSGSEDEQHDNIVLDGGTGAVIHNKASEDR
ncbi:MAG: hypothetical protein M1830_009301 [Pleopsidium flavum]|nr:MAG: hypothetical protein M1830_009301 [Pleopsidium flavum]